MQQEKSIGAIPTLIFIAIAVVGSLATWFSATAIMPELTKAKDFSPIALPWLTNAVQLGFVVGALGSSILNIPDRITLRKLMAASALLAALANALMLFDLGNWLILSRFFTGVALAGVYPPAIKLMATWFQKGRGLVLGLIIGALTLGSSLPHLFRTFAGTFDWQWVVMATSLTSLIAALLFYKFGREGAYPFSKAPLDISAFGRVLKNKPVFLANLGYFGHMWELYAMWGWFLAFATVASQNAQLELQDHTSLLTFCVVAAGVPGCLLGGWLSDKIGRTYTCALMMAISGTCALVIGFSFDAPLWLFITIAIIWGFSIIGDSAQFSAAITELTDQAYVGTALALQLGLGFALTILIIWLVPILASIVGWQWVFLFLAPGPYIGVIAMLILRAMPEAKKMAGGKR
jgi:MFS family permease